MVGSAAGKSPLLDGLQARSSFSINQSAAHILLYFSNMSLPESPSVLPLEGEIDLNVSPQLASTFNQMIRDKPPRLVVDLSQVTYIDSSGLAVLIGGMQCVEEYGGKFALAGLPEDVRSILEIARLDKFFVTYPHVDAALAAD
jgi:anti-sigma B factor antagonist